MPQEYNSNDSLNFCTISKAQNADNATTFRIWSVNTRQLREIYAINNFILDRRRQ